jgi:hypothetical protein
MKGEYLVTERGLKRQRKRENLFVAYRNRVRRGSRCGFLSREQMNASGRMEASFCFPNTETIVRL